MASLLDKVCNPELRMSEGMFAWHEHACGWLQTVDGLSYDGPATRKLMDRKTAALAADLGFRGDSVRRAYRFLCEHGVTKD